MYMRNIADIWKDIRIADILKLYEIGIVSCVEE